MIVDKTTIDKLVEKSQDTVNCQTKESIEKHIVEMLQKNGSAKLTINLNFALTGRKITVDGDATASSQEKHKDTLIEIILDDHPDMFEDQYGNDEVGSGEPLQIPEYTDAVEDGEAWIAPELSDGD